MTNAPFLLNTTPGSLILLAERVYARCKMTRTITATAGDQASLQALLQKPKEPTQTVHSATEALQYNGPPKDMLRGPCGPAPINMPPRARKNAKPAVHSGPSELELWMRDIAIAAGNFSIHCKLFDTQGTEGWSPHFAAFWKNALGNLSLRALKACLLYTSEAADE